MSEKTRDAAASAALIASQALACAALAQQTDESRPRQSTLDRGTPIDLTRKTNSAMSKTVTPQSFATQAAVIGTAEIELGQLALQNSQDPTCAYAQRMVKDHQAADAKLKKIAGAENLEPPHP